MKTAKTLVLVLLLLTTIASARRRDPLTEAEADQIRQAALEPYKRLQLYIKFTGARLDAIEQLRADTRQADGRGRKIHDLLEDFTSLMDEINENLDQYQGRQLSKDDRKDFRKGLKEMITACDAWDGHGDGSPDSERGERLQLCLPGCRRSPKIQRRHGSGIHRDDPDR